jgi:hypothetical protein
VKLVVFARLAAALLLVALGAGDASAQQAALKIVQGPYYTGAPIEMHVVAEGFDEEPTPDVSAEAPPRTRLEFLQARPQVSSSLTIVNGRMSQSRTVHFAFVHRLTVIAPGTYTIGPFTVSQNGKTATTRAVNLQVVDMPEAKGQRLRVVLPREPVFIGQRVPVTVEWWTEAGLADRLYDQHLDVPLFLDTTNFQFLDDERVPSRIALQVNMPGGEQEIPAEVRQASEGGKNWVIRSFSRTLIPVAPGRFDLGRPALFCEEAVGFQRDLFGTRVPSQTRKLRVTGEALVLEVKPVPAAGRPPSFAGAIGQGFTMDVAADRTVLQAGDPLKLSFTIRGDGSLDSASLPNLAAAGLPPERFRLPGGDVAGLTDERGKHFEVTVRVTEASVREVPPIAYSWFDPSTGRFETTHSQPIALSVREATVVGAGDVVSAAPAEGGRDGGSGAAAGSDAGNAAKTEASRGAAKGKASRFTLTGADLSVETDLARLRTPSASWLGSATLAWSGYAAGFLAIGAGLLERRRRRIDPVRAALRKELKALRGRVASERSARQVADALRRMAALVAAPEQTRERLDAVLAGLDETAFAPGADSGGLSDPLRNEAVAVADAFVETAQ